MKTTLTKPIDRQEILMHSNSYTPNTASDLRNLIEQPAQYKSPGKVTQSSPKKVILKRMNDTEKLNQNLIHDKMNRKERLLTKPDTNNPIRRTLSHGKPKRETSSK